MSSTNNDGGRPEEPRVRSGPPTPKSLTLPGPEAGPVRPHDHDADGHDRVRYAATRLHGDYACSASISRSRW